MKREGWQGWDAYAPFYDWENAQTLGRRDVAFWRRVAGGVGGPVLELGCGTGRVSLPLARAGVNLVGIDRSAPMLDHARRRITKSPTRQIANSSDPAMRTSCAVVLAVWCVAAGVSGGGPERFDQPTDVAVSAAGDIFVTDSHRNGKNNRVVRFTKDGAFVKEWGRKGSGRGEFSEPHTIAIDSRGRLFVGDRENNRIQIFDQNGTWLDEWRQFGRPSGIFITSDDMIYVADSESGPDTGAHELPGIKKGILIGSAKDGTVTALIEDAESTAADHSGAEGVGVDAQGNVYGGVVRRQMLERHVKK